MHSRMTHQVSRIYLYGLEGFLLCIYCNGNLYDNAVEAFVVDDKELHDLDATDSTVDGEEAFVVAVRGPSKR